MPSGDRTGPMGQGPMTGRSLGFCTGYDTPGYAKGMGRGMGRGFRFGRQRGWRFGWRRHADNPDFQPDSQPDFFHHHPVSKEEEISMLKYQSEYLKRYQRDIDKRLDELEKKSD